MAFDDDLRLQAEAEAEAELELEQEQARPKSELRAATPTSWGVADPIRKGLYAVTGDEMFDDMKGVPIQENWNNGNLEGYSYGGKLRNSLAAGTEIGGGLVGGALTGLAGYGNPIATGAGFTAGEAGGRGLNRALGLRPLEDVNTGEKEGFTDQYTSINPIENPAILNMGIPVVGKLAGSLAPKLLSRASKLEEAAIGIKPKVDFKPDKYGKVAITPEDVAALKEQGLFSGPKNLESFSEKLEGSIADYNKQAGDLIKSADDVRELSAIKKVKLEFPIAEQYIESSSKTERDELRAELKRMQESLDKYLDGSVSDLQREKQGLYKIAYNTNKPQLTKAVASDIKTAIEKAVTEAGGDIGDVNKQLSLRYRMQPILERALREEETRTNDPLTALKSKLYTSGPLAVLGGSAGGLQGGVLGALAPFAVDAARSTRGRFARAGLGRALASGAGLTSEMGQQLSSNQARALAEALASYEQGQ